MGGSALIFCAQVIKQPGYKMSLAWARKWEQLNVMQALLLVASYSPSQSGTIISARAFLFMGGPM